MTSQITTRSILSAHLEELVACPDCQQKLKRADGNLECRSCQKTYSQTDIGTFDLRPKRLDEIEMTHRKISLSFSNRLKNRLKELGIFTPLRALFRIIFFPRTLYSKLSYYATQKAYRELYSDEDVMKEHFQRLLLGNTLDPHETLLEVSCATGRNVLMLNRLNYKAVGIDIQSYDEYWKVSPESFFVANAYCLPFLTNSLEYVLSYASLEHLKDEEKAVSEISRVLKEDGKLFLMVPQYTLYNKLWKHCKDSDHYREYKLPELTALLQRMGFEVIRTERKWFISPVAAYFVNEVLCILSSLAAGQRGVWKMMDFLERLEPEQERGHLYVTARKMKKTGVS